MVVVDKNKVVRKFKHCQWDGCFSLFGGVTCSVLLLISSGGCEGSSDSCEEQLEEVKRLYADKEYSKAIQVQI